MDEQNTVPEKKKQEGIDWSRFKPQWDNRQFAKLMKESGLTSHKAVISNQRVVLGILRGCWQMELPAINEFAREHEQEGG